MAATAAEIPAESPAISQLGCLFRFTEIHLWDNSNLYSNLHRPCNRHIYFEDESESLPSTADVTPIVTQIQEEDMELAHQMHALGLPFSFNTTKKNNTFTRGKKKGPAVKSCSADNLILDNKVKIFCELGQSKSKITVQSREREKEEKCSGRYYYYNTHTEESMWDPPSVLDNFALSFSTQDADKSTDINQEKSGYLCETKLCDVNDNSCLDKQEENSTEEQTSKSLDLLSNDFFEENIQNENCGLDDLNHGISRKKKKKRVRRSKSQNTCEEFMDIRYADISKYWGQRYTLFSRFDSGVQMDGEGWFSVTPEPIAIHHAFRCGTGTVIDCFTGVGGNSIQFAMKSNHVIAIDIDPKKIDYASHNASIYGVNHSIDFVVGDFIHLAPHLKGDTAFLSPPWGGPDYTKYETYDIRTMLKPCDGYFLFKLATKIASRVVMFLPRNVNLDQLAQLSFSVDPPWSLEVEKNFLNGKLKAVTAYFEQR